MAGQAHGVAHLYRRGVRSLEHDRRERGLSRRVVTAGSMAAFAALARERCVRIALHRHWVLQNHCDFRVAAMTGQAGALAVRGEARHHRRGLRRLRVRRKCPQRQRHAEQQLQRECLLHVGVPRAWLAGFTSLRPRQNSRTPDMWRWVTEPSLPIPGTPGRPYPTARYRPRGWRSQSIQSRS